MGDSDGPRAAKRGSDALAKPQILTASGTSGTEARAGSARLIALVGPYLSGKTTLLEAILARTGAIPRQGTVAAGNTVGDANPEARAHAMSVEMNIASTEFMGDTYTFIDCPGSIEYQHEASAALSACDAAIVVCEPDPRKAPALQLLLRQLEDRGIPRFLFINKIDKAEMRLRDLLPALQPASRKPLVLRHIPIWQDGIATGFVDLALERAFVYREHAPSEVVAMPTDIGERENEARFQMLEKLADYDDSLMEQLLSDIPPARDAVFEDLASELRDGLIVPVLIGSAEKGNGISRLLKALRHEAPTVFETVNRLGLQPAATVKTPPTALILKTLHTSHGGKLSVARVLSGAIVDGETVAGPHGEDRIAGMFSVKGQDTVKRPAAKAGDTVALGRLDHARTGDLMTLEAGSRAQRPPALDANAGLPSPVYGVAIAVKERRDEVKLTAALTKIMEEDPSLQLSHSAETGQFVLAGQGDMHIRVALERLTRKYGVAIETHARQVAFKETIRTGTQVRGRHKKQSGGHGQFGDVVLEIEPLPRGTGFQFRDRVTGGVVPKQFFGSVEKGVRDYLLRGPLGYPVVDIGVTLIDGSTHAVDSSDMAFQMAGRVGMVEGLPKCGSVLLEPIMAVDIAVPSEATARITGIIASHRGQILGFDARPGWDGWDLVQAQLPEVETERLIIELRSATSGVGTFTARFDHMAELTGKLADQVLAAQPQAA
jgi:elongation factor G